MWIFKRNFMNIKHVICITAFMAAGIAFGTVPSRIETMPAASRPATTLPITPATKPDPYVVRIYYVADLLVAPKSQQAPTISLNGLGNNSTGLLPVQPSVDQKAKELIDLIKASIRPEMWSPSGPATIAYINGYLVVSAPESAQAMIGGN